MPASQHRTVPTFTGNAATARGGLYRFEPLGAIVLDHTAIFEKCIPFKANSWVRLVARDSRKHRGTPGLWFASALHSNWSLRVRESDRQNESEPRPILAVRQRRKFAAVTLDNQAANGQSQSHSIWLRRDEWIKYAFQSSWIDSRSGIFHCDDN